MLTSLRKIVFFVVVTALFTAGPMVERVFAAGQASASGSHTVTPQSPRVAAGEVEARKLLLLMDADKNGKVSKQEFMNFMEAEFNRLDMNKNGELDVKELTKSQFVQASHHGKVK